MRKIDNREELLNQLNLKGRESSHRHIKFHGVKQAHFGGTLQNLVYTDAFDIGISQDIIFPYVAKALERNNIGMAGYVVKILNKDIDKLEIRSKLVKLEEKVQLDIEDVFTKASQSIGDVYAVDGVFIDCVYYKGTRIIYGNPISILTTNPELAKYIDEQKQSKDSYIASLRMRENIYLNINDIVGFYYSSNSASYDADATVKHVYNRDSWYIMKELLNSSQHHYIHLAPSFDITSDKINTSLKKLRIKFVKDANNILGSRILIDTMLDISINKKKMLLNASKIKRIKNEK